MGRSDRSRSAKRRSSSKKRRSGKGRDAGRGAGRGAARGGGGRKEERELRTIFDRVDTDGSGRIEAAELAEALQNGSWEPFNPATVAFMVGMFDRDGDGSISFGEFKKLWKYVEEWTETFRRYDRDGSGAMAVGELGAALAAFGYRLSRGCVASLVRRFDRSGQGQLYFDDFVQACVVLDTVTQVFKERDAARRGSVLYAFEEFVQDSVSLVLRLQSPGQASDRD